MCLPECHKHARTAAKLCQKKMGEIEIVLMRFPIKNESQTNLFIYVFSCELVPAITRHSIISGFIFAQFFGKCKQVFVRNFELDDFLDELDKNFK